jgi:hypothetical protein
MSDFCSNTNINTNIKDLLNVYDRVMFLKIFVDGPNELKDKYMDTAMYHNEKVMRNPDIVDAGFDLFAPGNEDNNNQESDNLYFYGPGHPNKSPVNKLDFKICCSAQIVKRRDRSFNTGFYMYPRSSLSKTQLRLANSVGIIDAGYRGHLMAMFDVVNIPSSWNNTPDIDYIGKKFDRYVQICAPGLVPILVEIVNSKEELGSETERGQGGFGSTGR